MDICECVASMSMLPFCRYAPLSFLSFSLTSVLSSIQISWSLFHRATLAAEVDRQAPDPTTGHPARDRATTPSRRSLTRRSVRKSARMPSRRSLTVLSIPSRPVYINIFYYALWRCTCMLVCLRCGRGRGRGLMYCFLSGTLAFKILYKCSQQPSETPTHQ